MRFITLTLAQSMPNPGTDIHVNVEHVTNVVTARGETRVNMLNGGSVAVVETVERVLELVAGTDTIVNAHATPLRGLTELQLDDLAARLGVELAWIESQDVIEDSPRNGWRRCHQAIAAAQRELRGEA